MEIELILRLFLAGASIFIGLIMGIALLASTKTNKYGNLFLLILIVFFLGQAMSSFLMFSGLYKYVPHFLMSTYPLGFIVGATYYFYIRIVLEPHFKFKWYDVIHLTFMVNKFNDLKGFYALSSSKKISSLELMWFENAEKPSFFHVVRWAENDFLTIFYLIATVKLINMALNSLKSKSSNTDIEYLIWLKKSTYLFIALSVLEIVRIFIIIQYNLDEGKSEITSSIILLGFVLYLIFHMIKNPNRAFYKLNHDNFKTTRRLKNDFTLRSNVFFNNLSTRINKKHSYNYYVVITLTTIMLMIAIYFYFFNFNMLRGSNWPYFTILFFLFIMIFQFTMIDNHILYHGIETEKSEFSILKSNEKNNLAISDSKNDSNFLLSLKTIMKTEQPYLNSDLKSHELASLLNTTPHYLSKIINQELGLNFYSFINGYRIEEFKKRALQKENKNFTLTGIAKDVGFNSKSSFNRVFKATVGITPSEYIKSKKGINFQK